MKLKSIAAIAFSATLVLGVLGLAGCSSNNSSSSANANASSAASSATNNANMIPEATSDVDPSALMTGKHHAIIEVEGYDPINVELDADAAPISVTNFVTLANDGYYNGLTLYRVVEDFCLQGGTKGNTASGNDASLDTITGEFSDNGVENPLADHFEKGTIAMARTSLPNSATSTFFITLGDNDTVGQSLDGLYAAFGKVDEAGMAIVDQIVADAAPSVDDEYMGTISAADAQPVIKSITIVD